MPLPSLSKPAPTRTLRGRLARALVTVRRNVPPGLRLLLGVLLIIGGILGFLPVLGFWMIPLGLAVAALDVRPMLRRIRGD
ncbi:hypothetical protein LCL97_02470 [Seohaeicola saemankumensis]|nr:hypothetical protein [Seohaeicola saemankumensis]MCA0869680.1 hypothetical protein [Seohaeicola saemankumensis]